MKNPDPARITDEMWKLWESRPNPAWLLSGIYANKKGYHNTVTANMKLWPGNYSIKLALDLKGPRDKARAIDLTMTESEMIRWTTHMRDSAMNPADHRLAAVKEFYGTLNGKTVYGLKKDSLDGPWESSSADDTHLWHGHTSIFTFFVNQWKALAPILSVWAGQSLTEWKTEDMLVRQGDSGENVKYWQYIHNTVRNTMTPAAPELKIDGDYGATTAKAFAFFAHKEGATEAYKGEAVTYWVAVRYLKKLALISSAPLQVSDDRLKALVDAWMTEHNPTTKPVTP
jgi:hypothetical protein